MGDGLGKAQAGDNRKAQQGSSSFTQGVCKAIDWPNGLATINIGGGNIPMPMVGDAPVVGQRVWVGYLGEAPICLGPVARAGTGTAGANAGGFVSVTGDDGEVYSVPYLGAAPANPSRVAILWGPGGVVPAGALSAQPVGTTPLVPPSLGKVARTFVFYPTDSGNWYNNSSYANGPDPWCSVSNDGVYFYGTQIADSIPDDAEFVAGSLSLYLSEYYNEFPSSLATLGRHALAIKSGNPGLSSEISLPNLYPGGGSVTLPDSWEASFRLGSARGVGFNQGGYHKYRRAGVNGSGTITGTWKV